MKSETKGYLLKEYGSWSVLTVSCLAGLGVSRAFTWTVVPLFLALSLLINSKQAFMKWLRNKRDRRSLSMFLAHILIATVVLVMLFRSNVSVLLPLLVVPALYLIMNVLAGEHNIITELLGFTLLSLAAVLVKFSLTHELDIRLFMCVALYFNAGVFKIKAVLFKKMRDRVLTVLYVLLTVYIYSRINTTPVVLLPLAENIIMASTLYKVKLQTTGWIEVAKSLAFLAILIVLY